MKNSPMPSLMLGRFNLAYARLRGCFLQRPVENSMKRTTPSLRSESFMLASLRKLYARFARSRFNLSLFAPIRDALYLPWRIKRELVIREK